MYRNAALCLHTEASTLRLLGDPSSGLQMMKYFSRVQSGHRFVLLSYDLALQSIDHLMLKSLPRSFNLQMNLLSSVQLRLLACLKVTLCPLICSLKSFLVRPMYVSFEPSSSVVTVAWYIIDFTRHWPLSGQSAGFLQLQVFFWVFCTLLFLLSSQIFSLWPSIIFFTFGKQL